MTFETLRNLGSPEELIQEGGDRPISWNANSHVHLPPNFSAFDSVEQAVALAASEGVRVLGASNYYDFEIYSKFEAEARRLGVFPLFGIEIIAMIPELQDAGILINDPGNPGRIYLCGKGITRFDPPSGRARELLAEIRDNDSGRMKEMAARLERLFGEAGIRTGLDEDIIRAEIASRHGVRREQVFLQERHLAQAFQGAFFERVRPVDRVRKLSRVLGVASRSAPDDPVGVQAEIRSHLMKVGKPAFVTERFLGFDKAVELILGLGGIPSYPTLADGASPICPYEDPPAKLVETLKRNGVHCAEFIPIRNEPATLERYVRTMRDAGIVITAGTEHNTRDRMPLEPRCMRGQPVAGPLRGIFLEGACVVAAHQFLVARGRAGYVNGDGFPSGSFPAFEDRISYFRGLGAALIARYHEQSVQ